MQEVFFFFFFFNKKVRILDLLIILRIRKLVFSTGNSNSKVKTQYFPKMYKLILHANIFIFGKNISYKSKKK